jgi:serine/threonine protein kinase
MNPSPVAHLGPYTLLSELGRGTTGVVYKAQDCRLNRLCAIKTLLPCPRAELIERREWLLREAQVTASLQHEHIVSVLEANEYEGRAYCAREFVDGSTLETLVTDKSIDLRTGLRLLGQVCEAMEAVHARRLVHRNLLPANVLVESAGFRRAKLIGFGRVRLLFGSSRYPNGPIDPDLLRLAGQLKAADTQALHQMLRWLADTLGQPLPAELAALEMTTPAALADALRRHV